MIDTAGLTLKDTFCARAAIGFEASLSLVGPKGDPRFNVFFNSLTDGTSVLISDPMADGIHLFVQEIAQHQAHWEVRLRGFFGAG